MNTNLCDHLLTGAGLSQPFALVVQPEGAAYLCPSCMVDHAHGLLATGVHAQVVADSIRVGTHCEHQPQGRTCFDCRDAVLGYLTRSGLKDVSLKIITRDTFPNPREKEETDRKRRIAAVEARQAQYFRWDRRRSGIRS